MTYTVGRLIKKSVHILLILAFDCLSGDNFTTLYLCSNN